MYLVLTGRKGRTANPRGGLLKSGFPSQPHSLTGENFRWILDYQGFYFSLWEPNHQLRRKRNPAEDNFLLLTKKRKKGPKKIVFLSHYAARQARKIGLAVTILPPGFIFCLKKNKYSGGCLGPSLKTNGEVSYGHETA
jgi:hypothetical protein